MTGILKPTIFCFISEKNFFNKTPKKLRIISHHSKLFYSIYFIFILLFYFYIILFFLLLIYSIHITETKLQQQTVEVERNVYC